MRLPYIENTGCWEPYFASKLLQTIWGKSEFFWPAHNSKKFRKSRLHLYSPHFSKLWHIWTGFANHLSRHLCALPWTYMAWLAQLETQAANQKQQCPKIDNITFEVILPWRKQSDQWFTNILYFKILCLDHSGHEP